MAVVAPGIVGAAAPHRGFGERQGAEGGAAVVDVHAAVFVPDHAQQGVVHAFKACIVGQQIVRINVRDRMFHQEFLGAGGESQEAEYGKQKDADILFRLL